MRACAMFVCMRDCVVVVTVFSFYFVAHLSRFTLVSLLLLLMFNCIRIEAKRFVLIYELTLNNHRLNHAN